MNYHSYEIILSCDIQFNIIITFEDFYVVLSSDFLQDCVLPVFYAHSCRSNYISHLKIDLNQLDACSSHSNAWFCFVLKI